MLPAQLNRLSKLTALQLWSNDLTGPLPAEWSHLSNLEVLSLAHNNLTGSLPAEWSQLHKLKRLSLTGNDLASSGPQQDRDSLVPLYEVTNGEHWWRNTNWLSEAPICTWAGVTADANGRVTELSFPNNNLKGPLPAELVQLDALRVLWLIGNQPTGSLSAEWSRLSNLADLADNSLTGPLPVEGANLVISRNRLEQPLGTAAGGVGQPGQPRGTDARRQQPGRATPRRMEPHD